ncbi:hypothetical protein P7K49_029787, partial [Saguinus oedipus]
AMEAGAAGSSRDPRRRRRAPAPPRPRAPALAGLERGRQRRGGRAGHGGAAGPRWPPALCFAPPPPRLEVCRLTRKVALGLGSRPPPPSEGPQPRQPRSPACRGHVSRRRPREAVRAARAPAPLRQRAGEGYARAAGPLAARLAMGIQGMELCAMAVVVLLFIAVLKQFGILEPISMEGNAWPPAPPPPPRETS